MLSTLEAGIRCEREVPVLDSELGRRSFLSNPHLREHPRSLNFDTSQLIASTLLLLASLAGPSGVPGNRKCSQPGPTLWYSKRNRRLFKSLGG
jgi:hypothetical protein